MTRVLLPGLLGCVFFSMMNAQPQHFRYTITDVSDNVAVPLTSNPNINGSPLAAGDEIGAFSPAGLCVGAIVWNSADISIAVWGDDATTTDTVDGMKPGEEIFYRVWRKATDTEYASVSVAYSFTNSSFGAGKYSGGALHVLSSLTATAPPEPPVLRSPNDGATGVSTSPNFSWESSSFATSYRIQVATDQNFSSATIDQADLSDTSYAASGLAGNTIYYWRVQASNSGGSSDWSDTSSFTTIEAAPSAPILLSPENGVTGQATSLTLSWNAASGASSYQLQLSVDSTFLTQIVDQSGLTTQSFDVSGLTNGTGYFWRVNATNGGGTSDWSQVWNFTTIPSPPSAPTLVTPTDGAQNIATDVTLSWNPSVTADSYSLQVSTDSTFASTTIDQSNISSTSYDANGLSNNITYYWRVNGTNAGGTSDWSSVWSFTTMPVPPAVPMLSSPENGAIDVPVNTSVLWNPSDGASTYRVQISTDSTFTSVTIDQSDLSEQSYSTSGLSNSTRYFWRVNATNGGGTSDWSQVWNFTTIPLPPPVPTLVSPANGATNLDTAVTLQWNVAAGATLYHLQVSSNSGFSSLVLDDSSITQTSRTVQLFHNTTYYWRVRAKNSGGSSAFSASWNFTTKAVNAPTVTTNPATEIASSSAILNGVVNPNGLLTTVKFNWGTTPAVPNSANAEQGENGQIGNGTEPVAVTKHLNGIVANTRYYFTVTGFNSAGTTTGSLLTFVTQFGSIVPTLALPQNNSINQAITLTLTWNALPNAISYRLQVSNDPAFSSFVVDDSTVADTSGQVGPLQNETTYYWRVNAKNSSSTSGWSQTWNFTTVPAVPAPPTLVSPVDGALDVSTNPALSWNTVTGADSYRIQLSTDSLFSSTTFDQSGVTATTFNASSLSLSTIYFWRVNAMNAGGSGDWSAVWSFTTVPPPPDMPTLFSPGNGTNELPTTLTLTWNAASGAESYRLQVATSTNFTNLVVDQSGIQSTSREVSGLANNKTHYWRVNASNAGGTSDWSPVWSFTTFDPPPSAPTLVSPDDGATDQPMTLTLSWSSAESNGTYRLQVSTSSLFTTLLVDDSTLTNTFREITGLSQNTTYYWRVRVTTSGGTSNWSSVRNFTTVPPPPSAPLLLSPASGSTGISTNPTLSWNASSGASAYRVQLSEDLTFSTWIVDDSAITDWRVNASNSGGISPWSEVWNFVTIPESPPPPILVSPTDAAQNISTSPTLSWNPSEGAVTYHLQISSNSAFSVIIIEQNDLATTSFSANGLTNGTAYYWRVSAANAGGTGDWSAVWTFSTIPLAPDIPSPTSPPSGATDQPITLDLSWTSSARASSYRLQVSGNADFTSVVVDDSTITQTSQQVGPLSYTTTYYWRVLASNAGGTSAWSNASNFTTTSPETPPGPVLSSPPSGSLNLPTTLTLIWNSSVGAISYHLQVSSDPAFGALTFDDSTITNTSQEVRSLANATTYYWRARSKQIAVTSNWSSVWNFTTVPDIPPTPTLISPANNAINVSTSPTFSWNVSTGAISYRLQVSPSPTFSPTMIDQSGITSTSFPANSFNRDQTYYWRVSATNAGGTSDWSSVWSFTTIPDTPATPTLASPINGSNDISVNPTLSWNASTGAASYHLQISTNSNFTSTVIDKAGIADTSDTISGLAYSTRYYWRINATNSGGTSAWSTVWDFTTVPAPPATPSLSSPANGSQNQPTTIALMWNSSARASAYRLQVSADSTFTAIGVDQNDLVSTTATITSLATNTIHYWRVHAFNTGGTSAWSNVWSFTTVPSPPAAPTLSTPANGATGVSLNPTLSWASVVGASLYRLQLAVDSVFTNIVVNQTDILSTSYPLVNLSSRTKYFWRVSAANAGGNGDWSATWNFETISDTPPPPTLSTPSDGATNQPTTITLSWSTSTGATSYRLQLSKNTNFTGSDFDDSTITTTSKQVGSLNEGTVYYWHVNAKNSGGTSPWSPTRNFATESNNPQAGPILVSPPNGALNQPTTLTFSWNADPAAVSYYLQISTNSSFSSIVFRDSAISGTSHTVSSLNNNTVYYWRVSSRYLLLSSDWSNVWSFTTVPLPPPTPTLASPSNGATNVSTTPTLTWDAPLSTSCQLQVSTNSSFTALVFDDTTLTIASQRIGPVVTSTAHYWRVRARNDGGWSGFSTAFMFTTASGGAPIAVTGAPSAITPTSATLNASVNPNGYSTIVRFQYGKSLSYGNTVDAIPSTVSGTGAVDVNKTLEGLSPNTTYHYRVMATNSDATAYGEDKSFTTSIPPYPTTYTVGTTIYFPTMSRPGEYKTTDYRLVGLPGESNSRVESMIQGVPEKDWIMYWDNGAPTDNLIPYNSSNDIFRFTVGRAFWLINKGPLDMSGNIQTAQLNSSDEVEIPLHSGWNLISNPFDRPVLWSKLQNLNGTSEQIWSFSGSYDSSATLAPYVGYYFFNKESLPFLRIPYSDQFPNDTVSSSSPEPLWKIQIAASSGEIVDKSSWIGTSPGASVDRDDLDYHKPRGFGGTPAVYFDRPEWDEHYTSFGADFRPPVQRIERWSFNVESAKGARVDLTFKGISTLPAHLHTYLLDEKRARAVNLRSDSVYSYTSVSEVSQFVVTVGTQDAVDELLQSFNVPRRFVLGNNFPNPFNPSTLISFDIPTGSEIDLKVFNMIGQEVRTLYAGTAEPGRHWVLWDGKDNLGMQVPSGVYLYRLATNVGFSETRKMILLK
ncbi:MAG: fibronectin type III domain-containing protein [Ignavibacteriales bacterium]|nr:fibronectin type III domain-containing protein [Ignavibacteriales bacterium]